MKTTYRATFSNGVIVERKSHRDYHFGWYIRRPYGDPDAPTWGVEAGFSSTREGAMRDARSHIPHVDRLTCQYLKGTKRLAELKAEYTRLLAIFEEKGFIEVVPVGRPGPAALAAKFAI